MKAIARLAVAVALMAPVGVLAATSAGTANYSATCSGTAGNLDLVHGAGVGDNGGLVQVAKGPQQYTLTSDGLVCTGNAVAEGDLSATVTTSTEVNCDNLVETSVPLGGSGTLTWTDPAGMGESNISLQLRWTSDTGGTINGVVSNQGSAQNIFGGDTVAGTFTTVEDLDAIGNGGDCSATNPIDGFALATIDFTVS
ncbi:MAG: hypothetical protein ACKO1Y_04010 [Actinomycetota bacterium]